MFAIIKTVLPVENKLILPDLFKQNAISPNTKFEIGRHMLFSRFIPKRFVLLKYAENMNIPAADNDF